MSRNSEKEKLHLKGKVIKYRQVISNSVKTCQTGFQITAATYAAINHFRVQGDKMVLSSIQCIK